MSVLVLFMVPSSLLAAKIESCVEETARKSYVFTVYLKDDDIKIHFLDGNPQ